MKPSPVSRLWTWVILLLPVPLALWTGYLTLSAAREQRDLHACTKFIEDIEAIEVGIRELEYCVLSPMSDTPASELDRRRAKAEDECRQRIANLPANMLERFDPGGVLPRVALNLDELASVAIEHCAAAPTDPTQTGRMTRAHHIATVATGLLHGMVKATRDEVAVIRDKLTAQWRSLTLMVVVSCLLAILIVVLLHSYRLSMQALRQAEDARDRFFSVSGDMLSIAGFDGFVKQLNPAWKETLGHDLDDMLGRPLTDFVHPEDQAATAEELERTALDNATPRFENRYRTKTGDYRWLRWNATADLRRELVYATARDVTTEKRAEQALWESERRIRILYELTTELETGTDEQFREVLRVATSFLRQDVGVISHVEGDRYNLVHVHAPEHYLEHLVDLDRSRTYCSITLDANDVVAIEHMSHSEHAGHPCHSKGEFESYIGVPFTVGGRIYGTVCFAGHKPAEQKWTEADRELVRLLGNWVGRTLEKRGAEEALRESEARIRAIVENAVDGIITANENGIIESFNPACTRIFGYKAEEVVGENLRILMPPPYHDEHDGYLARYAETGERRIIGAGREVVGRHKDGTTFPLQLAISEVTLHHRKIFTGIVRDISDAKRDQQKLRDIATRLARSNSELQDFASVASHDLQEPLRKVTTFGDRLQEVAGDKLDERSLDYLARMRNAASRMQTLIRDLLTFARVTTKAQPFVSVDLGQVTREVLSDLEVRIEELDATVTVDGLPSIEADPLQMRQLLQNLVGNALKFHRPGQSPHVWVSAIVEPAPPANGDDPASPSMVCKLSVRDDGIGFDPKYGDRIFSVFQRLHGRGEYEGTGVGLAVCRKIAERHGGTITAVSTPGEGATFIVTLPTRQANNAADNPDTPRGTEA